MPSTYTTNLGIEKIATGEQSGTWGNTTNTNFDLLDQAVNGVASITLAGTGTSGSPNDIDITDGSTSDGRNKFIEFVDGGDLGGDVFVRLTPNDAEKILFIRNSLTTQNILLFQGTYNASNDIQVDNGKDMIVKFDGGGASATVTDMFVDLKVTALDTGSLTLAGTAVTATGAELNILDGVTADSADLNRTDITTEGTVEASKVVTANSSGDVLFPDNEALFFGTDSDLKIFHNASNSQINDLGTGKLQLLSNGTGIDLLKTDGEVLASFATDGASTLYYDNGAKIATTATGVDVTGTAVTDGLEVAGTSKVQQTKEKITVSATAATGTINYNALDQAVQYFTTDASGNWTLNVRGDGSTTLNSIMSIGETLTIEFLVTNGATAYYQSGFQIDGVSVTPKFQGGTAPTAGTANSIDAYTIVIIKTADATYTVLETLVDFS
jgi:hypothetical protein